MGTNSKSNRERISSTTRVVVPTVAGVVVSIIALNWTFSVQRTKWRIAEINSEGICSVQRTVSGNSYVVELSTDDDYNVDVLEELSNARLGLFTEITILGINSSSIPSTSLSNVSEVYVSDETLRGNDIARLAEVFPNCHIWKFDSLRWTESIKWEIGNLPVPSAVFISSKPPKDISEVVSFKQTSVFWDAKN